VILFITTKSNFDFLFMFGNNNAKEPKAKKQKLGLKKRIQMSPIMKREKHIILVSFT